MWSVAIPISTYFNNDKEINSWLREHNNSISDSIRHPFLFDNTPVIVITFTDKELAVLCKLMWT